MNGNSSFLQIPYILIRIFPVAMLVAYSQIIVKIRASKFNYEYFHQKELWVKIFTYFNDPWILSGYVAALLASIIWLFIVTKLPLVVAFPIYIGVTFVLVILGGYLLLNESLSTARIIAAIMIIAGIAIGIRS